MRTMTRNSHVIMTDWRWLLRISN